MKKEELESKLKGIEKELKRLKAILDKDPEEYAKELSNEYKTNWESNQTYPYKVGFAQTTIKWILEDYFKENSER